MAKFLVRQLDSWKSGDDLYDWDVNNVYNIGEVKTSAKNERRAIVRYLRRQGIVFKKNRTLIEFDGDNYTIIDRKTKEPIFDAVYLGED